jgi:hypothetical protein
MPRRAPRQLLLAGLALVVAAAAAGGLIGQAGGSSPRRAASLGASASVGSVEVSYPASWHRDDVQPSMPGIRFTDPIRIAASGHGSSGVIAGQVAATGPTLLPNTFLKGLSGGAPKPSPVRLGEYAAYRYPGIRPRGTTATATVFVVPTSKGVATIACVAGAHAPQSFLSSCDAVAASLTLHGVKTYPLGADPHYTRILHSTVNTLNTRRRSGARLLHAAKTPAAEARAATMLSLAYAGAAKQLRSVSPGPAAADLHAALGTALSSAAGGYGAFAAAAGRHARPAFRRAQRGIRAAERAVNKQLTALRARGY